MAQTKPKAAQFYGVSDNGTDGQFLKTDGTGGMSWDSPITNPTLTSIDYPGTATAADPAGGESVIINGTLFASGITCTVGGTSAVTAFNSANQITITTPAKAAGQYTIAVTNLNGGTASQANFIQYSGVPVWSTASGSLGSVQEGASASFQVTATEGSDTIEYAVTTGTLPTGLSLNTNTGAITGTAPSVTADTTTTFSITATDDENQTSSERSFSITVTNDNPSNYFDTILYNGNGSSQSITGLNFSPDFVWIKARQATAGHQIFDTIRGVHKSLGSNGSDQQYNNSPYCLTSFDSNGFAVTDQTNGGYGVNGAPGQTYTGSNANYVAWCWKAGGTKVANTQGLINTNVSANTTLGFSIVEYNGATNATNDQSNNSGNYWSVGHGLGATPDLVIVKKLNDVGSWYVGGAALSSSGTNGNHLVLNASSSMATQSNILWGGSQTFNNNTFGLGGWDVVNRNGDSYIAYCFTSKTGFSKVGTYTGNTSNPPIVSTGFEPAFLMIKSVNLSDSWFMVDNKRETTNPRGDRLFANSGAAEASEPGAQVNFLSNGFQLTGSGAGAGQTNNNGTTYLYLAFAADGSTTTPSLANSFAAELYTGNGGTKTVTTGFKTDLVWLKSRTAAYPPYMADSVRGTLKVLRSSEQDAQSTGTGVSSFGSTSFDVTGGGENQSGGSYVSWNWKAGGTPSINTDGTLTGVVSANQAAGFSVVQWIGNGTVGATVGHGLNAAPELFITKNIEATNLNWATYSVTTGNSARLTLNESAAVNTGRVEWNSTTPTSSVVTFSDHPCVNSTGVNYIGYAFTSIPNYQKCGSYVGNGTLGHSIPVGFAPDFVMLKMTTATGDWYMFDSKRKTGVYSDQLEANDSATEATGTYVELTSTGFNLNTTLSSINNNGETFIYLAIKEN